MKSAPDDDAVMALALREARRALARGEVPVGAVVVRAGELLGRGSNRPVGAVDPTAHAEVVALRRAARRAGNYRVPGADLFVTLEPCLMCLGASIHARIARIVYGAPDPRVGVFSSAERPASWPGLNHRLEARGGLRGEEAAALLREFFATRRREGRARRKMDSS